MAATNMRTYKRNIIVVAVLSMLLATSLTVIASHYVYSQAFSNPGTTYGPGDIDDYSYNFYKEGSTYYAKNGTTRAIDFSGSNISDIVQSAADALGNDGGTFVFGEGDFVFDVTPEIPCNIDLIGSGEDVTELVGDAVDVLHIIDYNPTPHTECWGPVIRDMTIRCLTTAMPGVTIDASSRVIWYSHIDKVRFRAVSIGVIVKGAAYHTTITNCRICAPLEYGVQCVSSGGNPHGLKIDNCDFSMQNDTIGIYLYASHATVSHCWFEHSAPWGGTDIMIAGGASNNILNNFMGYQPWGTAHIEIRDSAERAVISGNRFESAATQDIFINASARGNHRIHGNTFKNFMTYAINIGAGIENGGIDDNSFEVKSSAAGVIHFGDDGETWIISSNNFNYTGAGLAIYAINGGSIISDNYLVNVGAIGIYGNHTLVTGNTVEGSGAWGIREVGSVDYNTITSCNAISCTTGGILISGTNSKVCCSWNATTFVRFANSTYLETG